MNSSMFICWLDRFICFRNVLSSVSLCEQGGSCPHFDELSSLRKQCKKEACFTASFFHRNITFFLVWTHWLDQQRKIYDKIKVSNNKDLILFTCGFSYKKHDSSVLTQNCVLYKTYRITPKDHL